MVEPRYNLAFCTSHDKCGQGECVSNGTRCVCFTGYEYDDLSTFYPNCFMPSSVPITYACTLIVSAFIVLMLGLSAGRRETQRSAQILLGFVCCGLIAIILFGIPSISTRMATNITSWTMYLAMMVIHLLVLIPLMAKHLIPPAYRTVLTFPRWYESSIVFFVSVSALGIMYCWVFCLVGLSSNDKAMFNSGIHIWFAVCTWLSVQLPLTIMLAIRHLIKEIDQISSRRNDDPFFRDLNALRRRTTLLRTATVTLGMTSFTCLFVLVFFHFSFWVFPYHFVPVWILSLLLVIMDLVLIWFARSGSSSKRDLTTPKTSGTLEGVPGDMDGDEAGMRRWRSGNSLRMNHTVTPDVTKGPEEKLRDGSGDIVQSNVQQAMDAVNAQEESPGPIARFLPQPSRNTIGLRSKEDFVDIAVV